jgi:hypothetical protein
MIQFLTKVLVRTNSLLLALYTTSRTRVLQATPSDAHEKLPLSNLRALNFLLPPLVRTKCIRFWPIYIPGKYLIEFLTIVTFVLAGGRPISNFLFFLRGFFLPPVALRLCQLSLDIPIII